MVRTESSKGAALLRTAAINAALLLLLLGAAELGFRLFEDRLGFRFSSVRYVHHPRTGPWATPNQIAFHQTECFSVHGIHFNALGMRDRPRTLAPKTLPRIAMVGDSYLQGLQVADEQTVSRVLERRLRGRAEVWNFGVSSTGTSVQLATYRARVRPAAPDLVVLMFTAGNDLSDNHPTLKRRRDPFLGAISPYFVLGPTGELLKEPVLGRARAPSLAFELSRSFSLIRALRAGWLSLRIEASHARAPPPRLQTEREEQEAREITHQVLRRFAREVAADDSRFLVAVIPTGIGRLAAAGEIAPRTRETVAFVREAAVAEDFELVDLAAAFSARRERASTPVVLSFPCDAHWNQDAHEWAADALLESATIQRIL